ncbi:hypothetical protein FXO38_23437 [Capsicum annuum]|nr:hypothetical protein FXO38_23437 [Capsicum annuum]KAF3653675.1 hypothetical protein FXO37_16854 [Capsicum annuum]
MQTEEVNFVKYMVCLEGASRLGQLECLEVLKLKENAFSGMTWDSEIGGFSQLKVLWIERADLKTWKVANFQFQRLKFLLVKCCDELEVVPIELADVRTLQEMMQENTKKAINSAKAIKCRKQEIHRKHMQKAVKSKSGTEIEDKKKLKVLSSIERWVKRSNNRILAIAQTDSDYAGCLDDRKSISGYVFSLGSGVISLSSKKQEIVTMSLSEAEYIAATASSCQAF